MTSHNSSEQLAAVHANGACICHQHQLALETWKHLKPEVMQSCTSRRVCGVSCSPVGCARRTLLVPGPCCSLLPPRQTPWHHLSGCSQWSAHQLHTQRRQAGRQQPGRHTNFRQRRDQPHANRHCSARGRKLIALQLQTELLSTVPMHKMQTNSSWPKCCTGLKTVSTHRPCRRLPS